jgi:hypothetical protein
MRVQPALLSRADEFPMNLRGVCGFFETFLILFASQVRTSEKPNTAKFRYLGFSEVRIK